MRKKIVIAASVIVCLILFGIWYTRPLPFDTFFPYSEQVTEIQAYYKESGGERIERQLTPDVPRFTSVMELLQSTSYRRSLRMLLPQNGIRLRYEETDIWGLSLCTDDAIPFSGGLQTGAQFRVSMSAGQLRFEDLRDPDRVWIVSADNENTFSKTIAQILK